MEHIAHPVYPEPFHNTKLMSLKRRLLFFNCNRLEFKDLPISHETQTKALNSASLSLLSPTLSAFYSPKGMETDPECRLSGADLPVRTGKPPKPETTLTHTHLAVGDFSVVNDKAVAGAWG